MALAQSSKMPRRLQMIIEQARKLALIPMAVVDYAMRLSTGHWPSTTPYPGKQRSPSVSTVRSPARWISCLHPTSHPETFWPRTWNIWQGPRWLASWLAPACRLCCRRDPIHRRRGSPPRPSRCCCITAGMAIPKHPGKISLIDLVAVRPRAYENHRRSLFARRYQPQDTGFQGGKRPKPPL